ncbi:hypothetical protein SAMN04487846_1591 [Microbacterium sp. cf046]|uniref:polymer-forming cytoskeletal protein n=1 Tax=Microbacterium sp. cf046 TaxID=1761803 RepID=UPI0008E5C247|nr:polymer-forming cytoskeletal protein [Microbacterium sp. cf046]SFS02612.1 hypothetical protein SAMN04487846_1591 [Microbacterium sp. cf046]
MSHYTGDLVLRNGDFSCIQDSVLDGDLYVLTGSVSFSNGCRVNGDIWAAGNVTNNSQNVHITGSITTNGLVSMTANGGTSVGGNISAKGNVTLTNQGSSTATVGGNITSRNSISVGTSWTVTGVKTPNSPTDPVFDPTLAWLLGATKWIDLDNTGWGTTYSATPVCNLVKNNPNPTIASLISTAGTRLVLDFTSCTNNSITIALPNMTVRRDVVIIVKPSARLLVDLSTTIQDDGNKRQLFFVHSDASRAYSSGAPVPNCGNGNQADKFDITANVDANLRVMFYTACGFTGNVSGSLSGQFYTSESPDLRHASYTCKDMSWTGVLDQLGCKIKGAGGISTPTTPPQLAALVYQSER